VTWWESVPLPVLTFGAVAAYRCTDVGCEQITEKTRRRESTMGIVWTILAIIGLIVVIAWIL
jgi:predicted nucleic acid-binding Zn ribbon protein